MNQVDDGGDLSGAIERLARPWGTEVAPLRKVERCAPEPLNGAILIDLAWAHGPAGAPQRSAHAFRRILQVRLQPRVERVSEQPFGLSFGQHSKERIHARLDRTLAQQVGAKAVNRA